MSRDKAGIALWLVNTCLLFGCAPATALHVALTFVEGLGLAEERKP